ncbi:S8 family serine peptidase [Nereida sp. MMG025]|uniref:S8 family peptidase n=1 Tax=Nereida sp. MMG025 TaxID=2909981 RepID=UPI001F02A85C|nr:S8 family serine peptidase [Nereida sp. MMG025]MCF6445774.1 S8 family serine peptidase [Nereida sp. MMG025]
MPENGSNTNGASQDAIYETSEKIDILVGPRRSLAAKRAGIQPMNASTMASAVRILESQFGVTPERVIRRKINKTLSTHDEATDVLKYRMDIEAAAILAQTAGPSVSVEVDSHLQYGAVAPSNLMQQLMGRTNMGNAGLKESTVKIRIIGEGDKPVAGASVTMEAAGFPQEGRSNSRGELTMKLFELPGGNQVKSIFVRPSAGHWNRIINSPNLSTTGINVIRLKPIADTHAGFPLNAAYGWGQRLMGLDKLPDEYTGKGVKIAIIDSGADPTHPVLSHIAQGFDMTKDTPDGQAGEGWKDDVIGHGSHCAGVITGKTDGTTAIRGFAPDAEIIVMKVFPGGQFSSLLDALAKCIELNVDVVNMSLGGGEASEVVEQQIEECVQHGIACIVAAGNSGNEVQYPAKSPSVLAVAALGQMNTFPNDTWEATTMQPSQVVGDGLFSPSFTCHGPEIAVAGPGVGIISTVPGGQFDPQSGTSMATPHVCGMAALLVAHHPDFKNAPRDATRVAHLFNMIRTLSAPLPLAAERVGSGFPTLHGAFAAFEAGRAAEDGDGDHAQFAAASAGPRIGGHMAFSHYAPHPAQHAYGTQGAVYRPQGFYSY